MPSTGEKAKHTRKPRARRSGWFDDLWQDLRFGLRSAVRAPVFSLLAVVTLALGIGANAAVFGVVKSVLLNALPYADADRLVRVYAHPQEDPRDRQGMSAGTVADVAARQRSFSSLAPFYHNPLEVTYLGEAGPRVMSGALVGSGFFRTVGVPAAAGRTLSDADVAADAPDVVVLSHAAWQREFGGDPGVLGRTVRIDGDPHQVVGVLPRGFVGPIGEADLWFPLDLAPTLRDAVGARGEHWLGVVGRLKPGVDADAARRELASLSAAMAGEHPETDGGRVVAATPLRDAMVGDTRTPLLVLLASAGLVLLITCANLAGALLSRTISRRREFAVRVAMGAGRGRLVRQLLTESTLLALAGGAAGLGLAALGLALLRKLALPALPGYAELSLDGGAVAVTALVALATGLAFGIAPALSVGRASPQATLRDESGGTGEGRRSRRLRGALVAGQIALCVSLLVGAGLLVRSLWAMTAAPPGFRPDGLLTVSVQPPTDRYASEEARARLFGALEERLRGLPGVSGVAHVSAPPTKVMSRNGFTIEGAPPAPMGTEPFVLYASVSDDYFRTLGIPLRSGRAFGPQDHASAPRAVVVSEGMARRYWPRGGAIGSRIRMGADPNGPLLTVIGIVGDVRNDPARPEPEPMMYGSGRQYPWGSVTYLLRTPADPMALVKPVQGALRELDPGIPLHNPMTLEALLADGLSARRLPVVLMMAFGALALLLASVGIYAMFASMAAAREREFGVRMALGSSRRAIAGLVLRQGAVSMVAGLAGGALGVLVVARLLRDLLYGVSPFDPVALGVALLTLLACAAVALLAPVRRAARVDPATAMRAQ